MLINSKSEQMESFVCRTKLHRRVSKRKIFLVSKRFPRSVQSCLVGRRSLDQWGRVARSRTNKVNARQTSAYFTLMTALFVKAKHCCITPMRNLSRSIKNTESSSVDVVGMRLNWIACCCRRSSNGVIGVSKTVVTLAIFAGVGL